MKTNSPNKILIVIAAIFLVISSLSVFCGVAGADNVSVAMDPNEAALFELINVARKYPLGMAEYLGMDRSQVKKDLPELADILKSGLPELTIDNRLDRTAKEHAADMLENGYYSYESMDGRSVDQRMTDAGYVAADFGESLGMIAFNNFLSPQKAVLQIFESIYRNELAPDFDGQRNILNPDVKNVGISFLGGVFPLERYTANAYIVTCDFGSEVAVQDLQLMQLINQARAYPLAVAAFYNKDLDSFFKLYPEYRESMKTGLPALEWNYQLYKAAASHAADMAENDYVSHVSLDNQTPAMRLKASGYFPLWMAESIYRVPVYDTNPEQVEISNIFKLIFNGAFRTTGWIDRSMFSVDAVDAGMSVINQFSEMGNISTNEFKLSVIEYAAKTDSFVAPGITGTVFDDMNDNGLYDVGEEISGARVSLLKDDGKELTLYRDVISNSAGGFSVKADAGRYVVQVQPENSEMQRLGSVQVGTVNAWIGLDINKNTVD